MSRFGCHLFSFVSRHKPNPSEFRQAFFGWLLFNEPLPGMWWMGSVLILSGVLLIVRSSQAAAKSSESKEKKD